MAKKIVLTDNSGNKCYPVTRDECVKCGDRTLPEKFSELGNRIYKTPGKNGDMDLIGRAIKELYIPYDGNTWVLAVVGRNSSQEGWVVKVYTKDLSKFIVFSSSENPEGYSRLSLLEKNGAYLLIDWSILPDGYFKSNMTQDNYILDEKCFDIKYSPSIQAYITNKSIDLNLLDFLKLKEKQSPIIYKDYTYKENKLKIASAIKEIYLESVELLESEYIALSAIQKNVDGLWQLRLYKMPDVILVSSFETREDPMMKGFNFIELNGTYKGYALINWDELDDGTAYTSMTQSIYALSDKCYDLSSNSALYTFLTNRNISIADLIKLSKNKMSDPHFENIDGWNNQDSSLNTKITNLFDSSYKCSVETKYGENIASCYRIKTGYVSMLQFRMSKEVFCKYKVSDWVKIGMFMKAKMSTTGDSQKLYLEYFDKYVADGSPENINRLSKVIQTSEEWQWVEITAQMQSIDYDKVFMARFHVQNVTDYNIENTFGIEVKQPMICFYKNGEQITYETGFQENINEVLEIPDITQEVITRLVYSSIYEIGNHNNNFQFDNLSIGEASTYLLKMKPNFNLPNKGAYLSTDVENTSFRRDSATNEELLRAFSPYLYLNGKRKGCMVLFDDDGTPFIFNSNGEKKKISLVD